MTLNPVDYQILGEAATAGACCVGGWNGGGERVIMYRFKITRLLLLVLYNGIIIYTYEL